MKPTMNMGDAAYAASLADGVHQSNSTASHKYSMAPEKASLRRGKWTPEEEAFANRLIEEFKAGLLPLTDGTTLRTFLSKLLNCDPMRISKKFVGENCIGKQVFRHASSDIKDGAVTAERMERSKRELAELERKFLDRLLSNNSSTPSYAPQDSNNDSDRRNKKAKLSHIPTSPRGGATVSNVPQPHQQHLNSKQQPRRDMPPGPQSYYNRQQQSYLWPGHDPQLQDSRGPSPHNNVYVSQPGFSMPQTDMSSTANMQHMAMPYPPIRTASEASSAGGSEDWRSLSHQIKQEGGAEQNQMNWQQQYFPSQQFYDQHQNSLRAMSGPGGTSENGDEGFYKSRGSFYKTLKTSSTSSLDLLGTLATSISRENLSSYGNMNDSTAALNSLGSDNTGNQNTNGESNSSSSSSLKRNSKSIQDFWMLVEMGDLSRPDNEDMNVMQSGNEVDSSSLFEVDYDKSASRSSAQQSNAAATAKKVIPPAPSVSRCESAPVLSGSSSSSKPSVPISSVTNASSEQDEKTDSVHDPVILQSLLSMASSDRFKREIASISASPNEGQEGKTAGEEPPSV